MRVFSCGCCGQLVYFENSLCERCKHELGFRTGTLDLATLRRTGEGDASLTDLSGGGASLRYCSNAAVNGCNWLVESEDEALCPACALTKRIPDLSMPENIEPFRQAEAAKRRLVYALMRFGLPMARPNGIALAFEVLADAAEPTPVLTGHSDGLITINLAEADPAERERRRHDLGEAYRTLLGHFRHEVGHFYWDALVLDGGRVDACRAIFGDESMDYGEAMQRHYAQGASADWSVSFVSPYATMHPWEDFAETWAHYLHIVDALDTAEAFGLGVAPGVSADPALSARVRGDAYRASGVQALIDAWLPLSYALNSLNRSLGQSDLYPFVLPEPAIAKLGFIHDLIRDARGS